MIVDIREKESLIPVSILTSVEMADILSFNLTQTDFANGPFKARKMNNPDLSTKLKLMGVDVRHLMIRVIPLRTN